MPETHPRSLLMTKFKELMEQRLPGRVDVRAFPAGMLFKDVDSPDAVLAGNLEIASHSTGAMSKYIKEISVTSAPSLFGSWEDMERIDGSDLGGAIGKLFEDKGFKLLGWMVASWPTGIAAPFRVLKPEDIAGKKIRVWDPTVIAEIISIAGASPISMSFSEVAVALQTGVLDGLATTPGSAWKSIYDAVPYFTPLPGVLTAFQPVYTSKSFWEGLPADVRKVADEAIKESIAYGRAQQKKEDDAALAGAVADPSQKGVYVLSEKELAVWRDLMLGQYSRFENMFPKELVPTCINQRKNI